MPHAKPAFILWNKHTSKAKLAELFPQRMAETVLAFDIAPMAQFLRNPALFGHKGTGGVLNALLNTAGGATWVSFHHGGGVGMGYSQHSGVVIVCDGTPEAAARIERVLWNDPATGVMRHADAGYDDAIACAREHRLTLPMVR